jgi:hypothetical protein
MSNTATQTRNSAFSKLEQAIIQNGVDNGVQKALAVSALRSWENEGKTPEQIAEVLGLSDAQFGHPPVALDNPKNSQAKPELDSDASDLLDMLVDYCKDLPTAA